ncbi:PP0621 family protein [Halomonas halocynthiae]|uniref:PP0621 family protein n=1 Tax=Halomonas halocynthiae TaxID=176290 RepID=UPI000402AE66|nr:PP0621 family protein [Halomonas halocynthiae]
MNLLLIRLLIFAVLFFAGLKLYRIYLEWQQSRAPKPHENQQGASMVRCQWCNVHCPEDDALREQGEWFCTPEHRDLYAEERNR